MCDPAVCVRACNNVAITTLRDVATSAHTTSYLSQCLWDLLLVSGTMCRENTVPWYHGNQVDDTMATKWRILHTMKFLIERWKMELS